MVTSFIKDLFLQGIIILVLFNLFLFFIPKPIRRIIKGIFLTAKRIFSVSFTKLRKESIKIIDKQVKTRKNETSKKVEKKDNDNDTSFPAFDTALADFYYEVLEDILKQSKVEQKTKKQSPKKVTEAKVIDINSKKKKKSV